MSKIAQITSMVLIILGVVIVSLSALQLFGSELWYWWQQTTHHRYTLNPEEKSAQVTLMTPVSTDYGLVIPKINLNQKVKAEVDPFDAAVYLPVLKEYGVAAAKDGVAPGQVGTTYLFGHSTINLWQMTQLQAPFTLLNKLEVGDQASLFYQGQRYDYQIVDHQLVSPKEAHYLTDSRQKPTLIIQTCDPPGDNTQRLLVIAELIETKD